MTQGECLLYLREIHEDWSPTEVSPDKLQFLAAARLIELQPGPAPMARLTSQGVHCKVAVRAQEQPQRKSPARGKTFHHAKNRNALQPRPLV
jgi:hypothetical protein